MARLFAISDLHLDYATEGGAPRHLGGRWRDHRAQLAAHWTATVGPDDYVLVAGDIAGRDLLTHLAWLDALPGHKGILLGNHDPVSSLRALRDDLRAAGLSFHVLHAHAPWWIDGAVVVGTCGWRQARAVRRRGEARGARQRDAQRHGRELIAMDAALDLVERPVDAPLIVASHFPPDAEMLARILPHDPDAVVFGHWHGRAARTRRLPGAGALPVHYVAGEAAAIPHTPHLILDLAAPLAPTRRRTAAASMPASPPAFHARSARPARTVSALADCA